MFDQDWYAGRRVFVTGHTGFKGAWLCLWLQRLGAEVTGFALAPETRSLFTSAQVGAGMQSVTGMSGTGPHWTGPCARRVPKSSSTWRHNRWSANRTIPRQKLLRPM